MTRSAVSICILSANVVVWRPVPTTSTGLATALDLLGERWTLLIFRDLLLGPQRYTDLLEGLPGIGTNLLASRLKRLESLGVVRKRVLPPPAASTVYELTEEGRSLKPALYTLARWGARHMPLPESPDQLSARTFVLGIVLMLEGRVPAEVSRTVELRLGADAFILTLDRGAIDARQGPAAGADAVIETDVGGLAAAILRRVPLHDLEQSGALSIEGDRAAAEELLGWADASFVGAALRDEEPAPAS